MRWYETSHYTEYTQTYPNRLFMRQVIERDIRDASAYGWRPVSEERVSHFPPWWWWVLLVVAFPVALVLLAYHLLGIGGGHKTEVRFVRDEPTRLVPAVPQSVDDDEQGDHRPETRSPAPGTRDEIVLLRELGQMRDQGLITEDEYQQKRKDILDRI